MSLDPVPHHVPPITFDLALVGFGHVGRRLVRLLTERREALARLGFDWRVVAVATRRHGRAMALDGLDALDAATRVERHASLEALHDSALGSAPADTLALLEALVSARGAQRARTPLVVVETTVLDVGAGQPAIDHARRALELGAHLVTANKGPAAFAYAELTARAERAGRAFLCEGAVLDGVPVLSLVRETLPAVEVTGFRGIVNSTTNHVLTAMERGRDPADALREMQSAGIAEADASLDLDGWDAAVKTAVLVNVLMGGRMTPQQVQRTGIRSLTTAEVAAASRDGRRIKLVATARRDGGAVVGRVAPTALPVGDPLAGVEGGENGLVLETDLLGRVGILELDAGLTQTAYALLSDLVAVRRRIADPALVSS